MGSHAVPPPLIGEAATHHIVGTLARLAPDDAIAEVQRSGALRDVSCEPLLGLLDHLGTTRAEAYHELLGEAVQALTARIQQLSQPALQRLLETTFPFIGIEELKAVPVAVVERLSPVPVAFLKKLALDVDTFRNLPRSVQRQVWSLDANLFCRHVAPVLEAYSNETASIMRELDMSLQVSHTSGHSKSAIHRPPPLSRKSIRAGSATLRRLLEMVDGSRPLYLLFVHSCRLNFVKGGGGSTCSLRSQYMLLALDSSFSGIFTADKSPCLALAAELEECSKEAAIPDARLSLLLSQIKQQESAIEASSTTRTFAIKLGGRGVGEGDGDAALRAEETPSTWLADSAMLLRDPPLLHLLLHEAVRALEDVVEREAVPKDDLRLCSLSRLLSIALSARELAAQAIDKKPVSVPSTHRDVLEKFFPLLADIVVESQLRESNDESAVPNAPAPADGGHSKFVSLMQQEVVVRKVALAFVIQRLQDADLASAKTVLLAAREALTDPFLIEEGSFAATLARHLSTLVAAGQLQAGCGLWSIAVEGLLLRSVSISTEVHEEVLQLLLTASPGLQADTLARYLAESLHHSHRSRSIHRRAPTAFEFEPSKNRAGEDGRGRSASSDGVRVTYARIRDAAKLTEQTAPDLYRYLAETA